MSLEPQTIAITVVKYLGLLQRSGKRKTVLERLPLAQLREQLTDTAQDAPELLREIPTLNKTQVIAHIVGYEMGKEYNQLEDELARMGIDAKAVRFASYTNGIG